VQVQELFLSLPAMSLHTIILCSLSVSSPVLFHIDCKGLFVFSQSWIVVFFKEVLTELPAHDKINKETKKFADRVFNEVAT